jgi:outer membrane protein OmpA-like peptidoglycan-associated protein
MTPHRLLAPLIAAAGLCACTTPHSQPTLSKAVVDARAHKDVGVAAVCPPLASPTLVGFGFGQATIADTSEPALQTIAKTLACHPQATALVVGQADGHGTSAEQTQLATGRVQSVVTYLTAHAVAPSRLTQQVEGKAPAAGDQQLIVLAEGRRW